MVLPPERITVKRRRDEEPVDALYIQPKKYRPSAIWKRIDHGGNDDAKAQYLLPTNIQTTHPQVYSNRTTDISYDGLFKSAAGAAATNSARLRPHPSSDSETRPRDQHGGACTKIASARFAGPMSEAGAADKARTAANDRAVTIAPRRFHLTTSDVPAYLSVRSQSPSGIQKKKRHRRGRLPVFVEKSTRDPTSIKAQRALASITREIQADGDDTKMTVGSSTSPPPRKRPIITAAENSRKAATVAVKRAEHKNKQNEMVKTGCSIDVPSDRWNYESEELAEQLYAIALEQTESQRARIGEAGGGGQQASLKFQPKPPRKPRRGHQVGQNTSSSPSTTTTTTTTAKVSGCAMVPNATGDEEGGSGDGADVLLEEGYAYDTYVRETTLSSSSLLSTMEQEEATPLGDIIKDNNHHHHHHNDTNNYNNNNHNSNTKIGLLVIAEDEESLWEDMFSGGGSETEEEGNSEDQEDENAEGYYGNDYPDDDDEDDDDDDDGCYRGGYYSDGGQISAEGSDDKDDFHSDQDPDPDTSYD
ncbi:MAG: hypothetical protein Q9163_004430 [Psora crenata]